MALFVLSYARKDGEALVRKFFERLCVDLAVMHPTEAEIGFMDTPGIRMGATWQETLGGKLQSAPILVPVFSPSFFASEACGKEVQAFLERVRLHKANSVAAAPTPTCILPVIWLWENLSIHPSLRDIHYDNLGYPQKYRTKKVGLRLLADLGKNRDQFRTLSNALAVAINQALGEAQANGPLPQIDADFRALTSAFASVNPSPSLGARRSVHFAYVAPTQAQIANLRQNPKTYGATGRDWRAFDPSCATGIGHLSETVAAGLKLAYDVVPLDGQLSNRLDAVQQKSGQVVFVLDSWAAQLGEYDAVFTEIDKVQHRSSPVLVPLNDRDEENRQRRSQLLEAVANRLPGRAAMGGVALLSGINDESEFESQLARVLAARQSALIAATATSGATSSQLPVI